MKKIFYLSAIIFLDFFSSLNATILYTQDVAGLDNELKMSGGNIRHVLVSKNKDFDSVIIADLNDVASSHPLVHGNPNSPRPLSDEAHLFVEGWKKMLEKRIQTHDKTIEGIRWDDSRFSMPRNPSNDKKLLEQLKLLGGGWPISPPSTSLYMRGDIAVGLMIVSGKTSNKTVYSFTQEEKTKVISEALGGLEFFLNAKHKLNQNIAFYHHIFTPDILADEGNTDDYETAEAPWRDAALNQMGFSSGWTGISQLVDRIRGEKFGYVGFFTKYPLHHFGYQSGQRLVMRYDNDGWGVDRIDQVFAHETGHVFGAADEYFYNNVLFDGSIAINASGTHNIPNGNSIGNISPSLHENCLMTANEFNLCRYSRGQLGWEDWDINFPHIQQGWLTSGAEGLSLATHNGSLFLAFQGLDNCIYVGSPYLGGSLSPISPPLNRPSKIEGAIINGGLAIASFLNKLFLVYRGTDDYIYSCSSEDGTNWSDSFQVEGLKSKGALALTVAEKDYKYRREYNLILATQGEENDIWIASSKDGSIWRYTDESPVYDFDNNIPFKLPYHKVEGRLALTSFKDKLTLAYRGMDEGIYIISSEDGGRSWPGLGSRIKDWTVYSDGNPRNPFRYGPLTLTSFNDALYLIYKGYNANGNACFYAASSSDGTYWTGKSEVGGGGDIPAEVNWKPSKSASIVGFNNLLYFAFGKYPEENGSSQIVLANLKGYF